MSALEPKRYRYGATVPSDRNIELLLPCDLDRLFIPRIRMPHHAQRRIVPEHALDALRRRGSAVAHDHQARVLRVAHADAAAMMEGNPRRAARGGEERVQQ